jgi:3-dehydroquinate dehydratase-2
MMHVGLVNGPNLGRLGAREPEVYGTTTLEAIVAASQAWGAAHGVQVEAFSSNSEGALIDCLEGHADRWQGAVLNPGALAHYGWSLRDCVAALPYPVVEVHMTNVFRREPFRHQLVLAPVTVGQIVGLGAPGYRLALSALYEMMSERTWPAQVGHDLQGGEQP